MIHVTACIRPIQITACNRPIAMTACIRPFAATACVRPIHRFEVTIWRFWVIYEKEFHFQLICNYKNYEDLETIILFSTLYGQEKNETIISPRFFFVFLMYNFISTNRKGAKFWYSLPVGRNKIVHQENNNILGEIIASLFSCFVNLPPFFIYNFFSKKILNYFQQQNTYW